jgi:hypothetical protein
LPVIQTVHGKRLPSMQRQTTAGKGKGHLLWARVVVAHTLRYPFEDFH